jgi:ornithine carbamoyltransferase
MAIRQLGGSSLILTADDSQISRGETIEDTARVLSRYVDAVMIRANRHADVEALAEIRVGAGDQRPHREVASLPDPGRSSDAGRSGPDAQGLAHCVGGRRQQRRRQLHPRRAEIRFLPQPSASPAGYDPDPKDVERARAEQGRIDLFRDPKQAVAGADVVVADTFVSMGDKDADKRLGDLAPYKVSDDLMRAANGGAKFLHCLPAHRGEEVDADVIDGPQSLVFDEAENRLHAQKAILEWCFRG